MSTLFKCRHCGEIFQEGELDSMHTTYEAYYGVSSLFSDSHNLTLSVCPHCHSDEIEEDYVDFEITDFHKKGDQIVADYDVIVGDEVYYKEEFSFPAELVSNMELTIDNIDDAVGALIEKEINMAI